MNLMKTLAASAAAMALMTAYVDVVSTPAMAQQTTSSIRGVVTDEAGTPLSGVTVIIRDEATGFERTVTTNNAGVFTVSNLSVTGSYTVVANTAGYQGERVEDVQLSLGDTTEVSFSLDASTMDNIIVVGKKTVIADVAVGPNATFDRKVLETAPAINRNLTDIIRIDPRVFIDESRGNINSIQCAGQNPRFNSFTLDGVRLNDSFGLNANGYPTERVPFPFDAIEQVAVELAPFDVEYGVFSACNVNSVSKSGTNEIHGAAFFDYTSDGLRGDSLEGRPVNIGDFSEYRYGVNVGGPIVKDKLFFFAAYEKLEGANIFDAAPISQTTINEISQIARNVYDYDPGSVPDSFDNEDEKILVKLDWLISNQHRANFIFNYNDGFNIRESDGDNDEFEFSNHLYERGAKLYSYIGSVYSDWTDNFSTELRIGYLDLDNRQNCLDGGDFGEFRVSTPGINGNNVNVFLGCDDSRQSNDLNYDLFNIKAKGNYTAGEHSLTFGYEREALNIFNLFIQHTETETRFSSIDNFRTGDAAQVEYNNAPSQNPTDAAADWGYSLNSIYAQDEFSLSSDLSLVAGLRYDWYTSNDLPPENPDFVASYGFSNAQNLDGADLLQPRFGFTWDAADNIIVRGGVGLYSGGNPNVWLSNNYSANNVTQFGARERNINLFNDAETGGYTQAEDGVPNGPGYAVPVVLADDVAAGPDGQARNFEINYLDPSFEIPSEWKFAIGTTVFADFGETPVLGGEYMINADLLWSRGQDSAIVLRADLDPTGRTSDGRLTFTSNREPAFVLTNSTQGNRSFTASLSIAKDYGNGVSWFAGYAYNDSEDVNPMTSSVAFSNYTNRAFFEPQEQILSRSNYNIRHRFTGKVDWERAFWQDNFSRISIFGSLNSGQPYSSAFANAGFFSFAPFVDDDDPNILFTPNSRNSENGSWWGKIDIKLEQELPGALAGHKTKVFMIIDNFTNLLNDEWGVLREVDFPNTFDPTEVPVGQPEQVVNDASLYEIRFGVRYEF